MKTLILMRHAKSDWSDPRLDDHERPLNARGKRAAPVMAGWLAGRGLLPDVVLCSSAKRARQTVKRMRAAVPAMPEPKVDGALYHAAPGTMRMVIARLEPECGVAMLVGHEPGIGGLLADLTDTAAGHLPTAAMAVLQLGGADWEGVWCSGARLLEFARPRDLMEDR